MDPRTIVLAFTNGEGDTEMRDNYNAWVARGGFPARVMLDLPGGVREAAVFRIGYRRFQCMNEAASRMHIPFAEVVEVLE
jgi:hypothetical protein